MKVSELIKKLNGLEDREIIIYFEPYINSTLEIDQIQDDGNKYVMIEIVDEL